MWSVYVRHSPPKTHTQATYTHTQNGQMRLILFNPKSNFHLEKKKKRNSGRRRKMEGIEEISKPKENQSAHS